MQEGMTSLIWAACEGHIKIVDSLLAKEASVEEKDKVPSVLPHNSC